MREPDLVCAYPALVVRQRQRNGYRSRLILFSDREKAAAAHTTVIEKPCDIAIDIPRRGRIKTVHSVAVLAGVGEHGQRNIRAFVIEYAKRSICHLPSKIIKLRKK